MSRSDDHHPVVSVVVPVYNGMSYVRDALGGIDAQTMPEWEAILVDDGSTDGSAQILVDWAARHPNRVSFLSSKDGRNLGVAAARNLGLAATNAPYIAFLDQDDIWMPEKLGIQLHWLTSHPNVPAVSALPSIDWCGRKPEATLAAWQRVIANIASRKPPLVSPEEFLTGCPFPLSGALMRREALSIVKWFDPRMQRIPDWLFWACLAHGSESGLGVIDRELFVYRLHGRNEILHLVKHPLAMLLASAQVAEMLAAWLAEWRRRPVDEVRAALARAVDWEQVACLAGFHLEDWRTLLQDTHR